MFIPFMSQAVDQSLSVNMVQPHRSGPLSTRSKSDLSEDVLSFVSLKMWVSVGRWVQNHHSTILSVSVSQEEVGRCFFQKRGRSTLLSVPHQPAKRPAEASRPEARCFSPLSETALSLDSVWH